MLLRSTAASISRSVSGFVRPPAVVPVSAPAAGRGRFRPPLPVLGALTCAPVLSACIEVWCSTPVFHVRAFVPFATNMPSADFWQSFPTPLNVGSTQARPPDLPGYCALTFPLMPVGFTSQCSVQVLGFASIGLLTPLRRLYPFPVRRARVLPTASSRFHLTMDTLAVRLTLPLAGCVEDFPLRVSAPCRAHQQKGPLFRGDPLTFNSRT